MVDLQTHHGAKYRQREACYGTQPCCCLWLYAVSYKLHGAKTSQHKTGFWHTAALSIVRVRSRSCRTATCTLWRTTACWCRWSRPPPAAASTPTCGSTTTPGRQAASPTTPAPSGCSRRHTSPTGGALRLRATGQLSQPYASLKAKGKAAALYGHETVLYPTVLSCGLYPTVSRHINYTSLV